MIARSLPPELVIDCSIAIAWYASDERTAFTEQLLAAFGDVTYFAPALWRLEFVNSMMSAQRRGRMSAERLHDALREASMLPILFEPLNLSVAEVGRRAREHALTPYDLVYFELARRRGIPLATRDRALVAACRRAGVGVLTDLDEVDEPLLAWAAPESPPAPRRRVARRSRTA
ncbi:MAG TPA: type II toxin-antitoxin system VapC family toxin [Xanthomonadales bacterium]|nr:type II toxin-antitoxin system VapC family toxin [Xanthomonadales bacterium]